MAIDAGKPAHAFAVHLLVLMALDAELFRRKEPVQPGLVGFTSPWHSVHSICSMYTCFAWKSDLLMRLAFPLGMTLSAVFLAHDNLPLVPLGNLGGTMQHEADQQLVLLGDRKMMTIMTIELFYVRSAAQVS